jgi:hypothetical protein
VSTTAAIHVGLTVVELPVGADREGEAMVPVIEEGAQTGGAVWSTTAIVAILLADIQ